MYSSPLPSRHSAGVASVGLIQSSFQPSFLLVTHAAPLQWRSRAYPRRKPSFCSLPWWLCASPSRYWDLLGAASPTTWILSLVAIGHSTSTPGRSRRRGIEEGDGQPFHKTRAFRAVLETVQLTRHLCSVKIDAFTYNQTSLNTTQHITHLSYQPGYGLPMGDMYGLLMSGILGTLLGSIIIVASVWTGDTRVNISLTGRTVSQTTSAGSQRGMYSSASN